MPWHLRLMMSFYLLFEVSAGTLSKDIMLLGKDGPSSNIQKAAWLCSLQPHWVSICTHSGRARTVPVYKFKTGKTRGIWYTRYQGPVSWTDLSLESDSKVETLSQILEIFCWVCELRLNAFHKQAQLETWLSHRLKFEPMKEVSQIWVQALMPKNTYIKRYNLFQNEIDKSWNLLLSFSFVITATYSIFSNNKSQ